MRSRSTGHTIRHDERTPPVDWEDPELWRWIWLVTFVVFALGELAIATTFFLASFALGALVACVAAFAGGSIGLQWTLFVGVSLLSLLVVRPYSKRLDRQTEGLHTEGSNRWVGKIATVIREIPSGVADTGLVRVEREEWRAESVGDVRIGPGERVKVVRVDGTRMIVEPVETSASPGTEVGT
jgi:membrane protein implicated in regulation of membrane protease activity